MPFADQIHSHHRIGLNIRPEEGDLAIVSIDNAGTPGQLNLMVLEAYGYSVRDIPDREQLTAVGFGTAIGEGKKSILFVVTINGGNTAQNLEQNLYRTLTEFRGWFRGKKLWIPLMGTGQGGLSPEESYTITVRVINRFQEEFPTETEILLSIPGTSAGQALLDQIRAHTAQMREIKKLLEKLEARFYLAGAAWGNEDQVDRFIKEGIWETGYEDGSFASIISSIREKDILILKSSFATKEGENYLRVKAFGMVTQTSTDQRRVHVNWRITGLREDIAGLGYYRQTIAQPSADDVAVILSRLSEEQWNQILPPRKTPYLATLPGLLSDSDKGKDHLDIGKDVSAFARVMAARQFEPPLAVALFGKWGSGKSFFMRSLREEIDHLSSTHTTIYCEGIVHIHFNAWSYVDANLWASMVTRIFEGLQQYISNDSRAKNFKQEIEKTLTQNLSITQDEIQQLKTQENTLKEQIAKLNSEKTKVEGQLNDRIQKIRSYTTARLLQELDQRFRVRDRVNESLQSNESFIHTSHELQKMVPEKYWDHPAALYKKIRSAGAFVRHFWMGRSWQANLVWLAAILLFVWGMPQLVTAVAHLIWTTDFHLAPATWYSLSIAAPLLIRTLDTYRRLRPTIAAFWKIKTDYEQEKENLESEYRQKEKTLTLEIEKKINDIQAINQQLKQAIGLKAGIEYKMEHALSTQALYHFIERRCASEDYQKHLGIVSVIRKDFEILSELFNEHQGEHFRSQDKAVFQSHFAKPLQRIILYIDDLDRCPEDIVVQVIDAINLLMAYPLFIVVAGVDPVWIKKALKRKHQHQFSEKAPKEEQVSPAAYLEKIFQVPFHLKQAQDANVKEMIKQLAQPKPAPVPVQPSTANASAQPTAQPIPAQQQAPVNVPANLGTPSTASTKNDPETLLLTEEEITLMQDMSEVIGNNPRAIKRFVNTYRIIKAHEDFGYETGNRMELAAIVFLVALPIGPYKSLLPSFEAFMLEEKNSSKQLTLYLQPAHTVAELDGLKHELDVALSDKAIFRILQGTPVSLLKKHQAFIRRFTFKLT